MARRKKVLKRKPNKPKLPPSTSEALFYTFDGIIRDDNPLLHHSSKTIPPNFIHNWRIPPPINRSQPINKPPPIKKSLPINKSPLINESPPINKFNQTLHRYHRLWADTINELDHGFGSEIYLASYVEGYFWSAIEKRRFFTALDICGPQDPAAIQQRIGPTKTVYQVRLYISLLQQGSDENPVPEDSQPTVDDYRHPFAYEMSPQWMAFEEQQAQYLSVILDNETISLDQYHRSCDKRYHPEMLAAKQALDQELYSAQEFIDPTALHQWSARNLVDEMVPPTMTTEAQVVLYRLTRKFVADVMTRVILKRRQRQQLQIQKIQQLQQDIAAGDYSAKLEMIDDNCDIFDTDIEAALRDYYIDDNDADVDMKIKQELAEMKTSGSDNEQDIDSESDDDDNLGFVVGENSDDSSFESGSGDYVDGDTKSEDDLDGDSDTKLEDSSDNDSDGSLYQYTSSDNDSDQMEVDDDDAADAADADDTDDDDDDDGLRIMKQEDHMYEAQLYHQLYF